MIIRHASRIFGARAPAYAALVLAGLLVVACDGDGGATDADTAVTDDTAADAADSGPSDAADADTDDDTGPASDTVADTTADTGGDTAPDTAADTAGDTTPDTTGPPIDGRTLPWPGWDNATVYFVIIDRFLDGDPSNNGSYGRALDGVLEIGTFHGGDLAGLTERLNDGYFLDLGVSAIWITAPYEQIHGWVVGGGTGGASFKHYGYHGYYAKDFTRTDLNYGTEDELGTFIDTAHEQGIRIVFDIVMNHPGYATAVDLDTHGIDVLEPGWESAGTSDYYDFIRFNDPNFADWWGPDWVRAGLGGGYQQPGTSVLTKGVNFLPDFKTESTEVVSLPVFLANKPDTLAVERQGYTVRNYLVEWLTDWVRAYGVDGFRCDTAKHVEQDAWAELKVEAQKALVDWRAANPDKAFPDSDYADPSAPFWMTGEVFPHGVTKDSYFDNGFDSIINFDFAAAATAALDNPASMDATWATYAGSINSDPTFNVLSYLSSHDTSLFFDKFAGKDLDKQKLAGTLLLLTPGGVQIYYGDENARPKGPNSGDPTQPTRSDYEWGANPDVLQHWQRVGVFRKKHPAVGAGAHAKVSDEPYTFKRSLGEDVVYVVLGTTGAVEVDVSADFADGATLHDAYTGATAIVTGGKAMFDAAPEAVVLVEVAGP